MPFIVSRIIGFIFLLLAALGLSITPSPIQYENQDTSFQKPTALPETEKQKEESTAVIPELAEKEPEKSAEELMGTNPAATLPSISLPPITISTTPPVSVSDLNTKVRQSVVNVVCSLTNGSQVETLTGSGVVIDSRGVILTNAHVSQYFLLRDLFGPQTLDCVIRTGSPARPAYKAELLYISSKWIADNKSEISKDKPMGTGENDYALLLITKNADGSVFSGQIPALDWSTSDVDIDQTGSISQVLVGYPAGFLGALSISGNLDLVSSVATIRQIFTFKETTVDLMSLGGSIVAQRGASGGAVVSSANEKLVGLVVTTSDGETTGERDLRAITLPHINRSIESETGMSLKDYLSGNLPLRLALFQNNQFPILSAELKEALSKN